METTHHWRPETFDTFVGQKPIIDELRLECLSAKRSRRPIRHAVFYGPGGLGKNTVADILAREMKAPPPKIVFGSALTHETLSETLLGLESPGYDMRGNLVEPDKARFPVLVVDECQKVDRTLLEILHPVLEPVDPEGRLIFSARVRDPKRGNKYTVTPLWLVKHTIIFITNYLGELQQASPATMSRIPLRLKFEWYDDEDMKQVIGNHARQSRVRISEAAVGFLCKRCNGMPRQAALLLSRAADQQALLDAPEITPEILEKMFSRVGIDENGLDRSMIAYLKVLSQSNNGKMGLQGIASVMGEDQSTLVHIIEPVLMKRGLVMRATGGREITPAGMSLVLGEQQKAAPIFSRAV